MPPVTPLAPGADQLLDALDPEQRQVAEALRGPVRVRISPAARVVNVTASTSVGL